MPTGGPNPPGFTLSLDATGCTVKADYDLQLVIVTAANKTVVAIDQNTGQVVPYTPPKK